MVGSSKSSGNFVLKWFKQCLDAGLLQIGERLERSASLKRYICISQAIILISCEILLQLFPICQSFFQPVVVAFSNFFFICIATIKFKIS